MTPNLEDESLSSPSRRCVYLSNPASCELLFYKGYQWDLDLLRPENGMTDFLGTLTGSSNHRAEGTEELHTPSRDTEGWRSMASRYGRSRHGNDAMFMAGPGGPGHRGPGHRGPGHCGSVPAVRAGPLRSFHLYRPFVESTKPHLKSVAGYTTVRRPPDAVGQRKNLCIKMCPQSHHRGWIGRFFSLCE